LSGIVEHVEYQGHEALVHLNTGSQAAIVPDLESAQPRAMPRRRRAAAGRPGGVLGGQGGLRVLDRLKGRAAGRISGPVVTLDEPAPDRAAVRTPDRPSVISGDLVVRTGPDMRLR
ncbi:sugar ABC transporter ATP-binding protein, partial [Streptomyces sp. MBT57]|nr:sugar ABC transporter ATP-binding protein [Streptomyces sp. MBT57]